MLKNVGAGMARLRSGFVIGSARRRADGSGRRKHFRGGVKTRKQAEKELEQLLRPINDTAGYGRSACGATFKNLMEDYWPVYVSNQNMRPSTLDSYNSVLRKWIQPFFDDMRLEEITPRTITDFMAKKLIPATLASKTRRNIYNLLSEVFEVGVDNQLMVENLVRPRVHRPAVIQDEEPTLPLQRATGLHLFRHTAGSLLNEKTSDLKRCRCS